MSNCVEKTMLILRTISDCHGAPMSLNCICEKTQINKSTASHIIKTLCDNGYMQRISKNIGYLPGPELFFLTRYGSYSQDVLPISHPLLEWLHAKTHDTVIFAIIKNEKKYIIDRVVGNIDYFDNKADIVSDNLFKTVTGRLLLANLPEYEAVTIYRKHKDSIIDDWPEADTEPHYLQQLNIIKHLPVYFVRNVYEKHALESFATAVIHNGKCIGSLGGVITINNGEPFTSDRELDIIFNSLRKCAKEISGRITF
jgi:DNA-binding IclR family transcriptional regulator